MAAVSSDSGRSAMLAAGRAQLDRFRKKQTPSVGSPEGRDTRPTPLASSPRVAIPAFPALPVSPISQHASPGVTPRHFRGRDPPSPRASAAPPTATAAAQSQRLQAALAAEAKAQAAMAEHTRRCVALERKAEEAMADRQEVARALEASKQSEAHQARVRAGWRKRS